MPSGGHDHATLALLPFAVSSQAESRKEPVTIAYQAKVDGRLRRMSVTLRPGAELALPSPSDQLVFLGLLQLALQQDPPDNRLEFQRKELLDLIRWPGDGRAYDRLREALQRLTGLMMSIETEIYSRNGKPYTRSSENVHLIDRSHIGRGRDASCWIVWGDLVREAIVLGDFKRLDWNLLIGLSNPVCQQLYRLLDRVVLSGEQSWSIGWRSLAQALGLSTGYAKPAKFKDKIADHIDSLIQHGVIDRWEYQRGGTFVFHMRNYLRSELRRVLRELGVYDEAARQLVAGHDEVQIMCQCDQLRHGSHPKPDKPGGWLTNAIRETYELKYANDEPEAFCGLWGMLSEPEREEYHQAGLKLCGVGDNLFATRPDPTAWPQELRAVVRFLVCYSLEPRQL